MSKHKIGRIPMAFGAMLALSTTMVACGGGTASGPTIPSTGPTVNPGGGGGTAPPTSAPTTGPIGVPTAGPTAHPTAMPTTAPTTAPLACSAAAAAAVPGTYTSFEMAGNVNGGTFTVVNGQAAWIRENYTAATPAPTPSSIPTSSPTASPTPGQPLYLYSGTYTVKHHNGTTEPVGCAFLETSQNGAPIMNQSANALSVGSPNFKVLVNGALVASGSITNVSLTLSASGGSGTFSMDDGSTGTLNFNSRISVASFKLHR